MEGLTTHKRLFRGRLRFDFPFHILLLPSLQTHLPSIDSSGYTEMSEPQIVADLRDEIPEDSDRSSLCYTCRNLAKPFRNIYFFSLRQSAEDGCPCCMILLRILESFEYGSHRLVDAAAECYLDTQFHYSKGHRHAIDLEIPSLNVLIGLTIKPGNDYLALYNPC